MRDLGFTFFWGGPESTAADSLDSQNIHHDLCKMTLLFKTVFPNTLNRCDTKIAFVIIANNWRVHLVARSSLSMKNFISLPTSFYSLNVILGRIPEHHEVVTCGTGDNE
jgi:hypothetical protein